MRRRLRDRALAPRWRACSRRRQAGSEILGELSSSSTPLDRQLRLLALTQRPVDHRHRHCRFLIGETRESRLRLTKERDGAAPQSSHGAGSGTRLFARPRRASA